MKTVSNDTIPRTTKSPEDIIRLFNTKEIDTEWSFLGYKPSDTGKWTHDYHRYPAKFIPQLVEKLIEEYIKSKEAHINDPFMGCGTDESFSTKGGRRYNEREVIFSSK